jgi:hypothetical protein
MLTCLTRQGRLIFVEIYREDGRAAGIAVLARERLNVVNVDTLRIEEGARG